MGWFWGKGKYDAPIPDSGREDPEPPQQPAVMVSEAAERADPEHLAKPAAEIALAECVSTRRHQVLEFQTYWCTELERRWQQFHAELLREIEPRLQRVTLLDLARRKRFYRTQVLAVVRPRAEALAGELGREVQVTLNALEKNLQFGLIHDPGSERDVQAEGPGVLEVASAVGPMFGAAGVAVGAVSGSVAVSTAGVLGLSTVATVSWPVVAGGVVGAAVLGAVGVINTQKMRDRMEERFVNAVRESVFATLIYSDKGNALQQQMQAGVCAIAQQLLAHAPDPSTVEGVG